MQVIIIDKKERCLYRFHNIPETWTIIECLKAINLKYNENLFNMLVFKDNEQLCIDDFVYVDGNVRLTSSECN